MTAPLFQFYASTNEKVPLSINECYTTFRGKRVLKKAGKAFKQSVTDAVSRECVMQPWVNAVCAVYVERAWVRMTIFLYGSWLNASWTPGAKTKNGDDQSPYQKKDASNYIKLIEDAVADGTGIDDSAHFDSRIVKRIGEPCVEIAYEVLPWPPS